MKFTIYAVAAALLLAFCTKEKHDVSSSKGNKTWPWFYWTYVGDNHNYFQQHDPYYYVLDEDQFPDCLNTMGHTRCSIRAMGDAWVEGIPDLNTIQSVWYRPL